MQDLNSKVNRVRRYVSRAAALMVPGRQKKKNAFGRRFFRFLGGPRYVKAKRYDGMFLCIAGFDVDRILHGPDHKRFGPNNLFPIFKKHVRKGSVVIDVGAGMGDEIADFSQLTGDDGMVLSFEPFGPSFYAAQETIKLNNFKNVTLLQKGISDRPGFLDQSSRITGSDTPVTETQGGDSVSVTTLDDIYQDYRSEIDTKGISVIKIDTDGHDLDVLKGGSELFKQHPDIVIVMEYLPTITYSGMTGVDVLMALDSMGFLIHSISPCATPVVPDGSQKPGGNGNDLAGATEMSVFAAGMRDRRNGFAHDIVLLKKPA